MTHRQWLVWLAWEELDWNTPSRADYYAMATTRAVRRQFDKRAPTNLDEYRILLERKKRKPMPRGGITELTRAAREYQRERDRARGNDRQADS